MNLERLPNEEKLSLCRKYYLGESTLKMDPTHRYCTHCYSTKSTYPKRQRDDIVAYIFLKKSQLLKYD